MIKTLFQSELVHLCIPLSKNQVLQKLQQLLENPDSLHSCFFAYKKIYGSLSDETVQLYAKSDRNPLRQVLEAQLIAKHQRVDLIGQFRPNPLGIFCISATIPFFLLSLMIGLAILVFIVDTFVNKHTAINYFYFFPVIYPLMWWIIIQNWIRESQSDKVFVYKVLTQLLNAQPVVG